MRKAVTTGDWSQLSGTIYKAVEDELWVVGQVEMRGTGIVMPQSLWKQTIMLAHEGNQGMVRVVAANGQTGGGCHTLVLSLRLVGPRAKPEPVRSSSLRDGP